MDRYVSNVKLQDVLGQVHLLETNIILEAGIYMGYS